jgi:Na+/H+-dicarboxylate symporter
MESTNKSTGVLFIILELILGIILGFIFLKFTWNNDSDVLWGKTIADGLIRIYGMLSLIFFFAVFLVGIIGAIKLKRSNKIGRAIVYSILFWLLSLIASVFLAQFAAILSLYIILAGIVVGFNLGIGQNFQEV